MNESQPDFLEESQKSLPDLKLKPQIYGSGGIIPTPGDLQATFSNGI